MLAATLVGGLPAPAAAAAPEVEPGVADSVTRLYLAVFDREPDETGRQYWVGQYINGTSLPTIAASFMSSNEWQRHMGQLDDAQFVDLLYRNVLDRAADDNGRHYWVSLAAAGLSRTDMLLWFSESAEFINKTGTHPPVPPPFPALPPNSGTGRRIVYSNREQRVWIVEGDGAIHDSYLVSGRRSVPGPGVYAVYSKSPVAWAGHDGITMKHMVRFAHGRSLAIGFHSIPRYAGGTPMQTESQLGTYRSAGCVRQADHQAEALYHWAQLGDTVVVLP